MSVTFYTDSTMCDDDATVNMNSTNAGRVLGLLGLYEPEMCGSIDAESFEGRVLLAQALTPADAGVVASELPGSGARWIDCGRPEGYLQMRLEHLLDFVQAHRGETIHWA